MPSEGRIGGPCHQVTWKASERETGRQVVVEGLAAAGLVADAVAPDLWLTALPGERKRNLPVVLRLADRSLHIRALLCGALDEGHAEVYRYLLERNQRTQPVHFALDEVGDLLLTGQVPLAVLDVDTLTPQLGSRNSVLGWTAGEMRTCACCAGR